MDSFGTNTSSCASDLYSCGSIMDGITNLGGSINASLSFDDGIGTYWCATLIAGNNATTTSCVLRPGFNNTICDTIIAAPTNKSEWYTCPNANMTGCGWNGNNGIPLFGVANPTKHFQINTSLLQTKQFIFIEYVCNETPKRQLQTNPITFIVTSKKSVSCVGNDYESIVFDENNNPVTLFSPLQSCTQGSFCDPSLITNSTIPQNVSRLVCTPGCHDNAKDGSETDIDYGGSICGNCTVAGKNHDEFYAISRELQENERGVLTATNSFDPAFCTSGTEAGAGSIAMIGLVIIISFVTLLVIAFIILPFFVGGAILLYRYVKRKRSDRREKKG